MIEAYHIFSPPNVPMKKMNEWFSITLQMCPKIPRPIIRKCLNNLRLSATNLRFHQRSSIWSCECNGNILLHIESNIANKISTQCAPYKFIACGFFPRLCRLENLAVISIVESYPIAQLIGLDVPEDIGRSCLIHYYF